LKSGSTAPKNKDGTLSVNSMTVKSVKSGMAKSLKSLKESSNAGMSSGEPIAVVQQEKAPSAQSVKSVQEKSLSVKSAQSVKSVKSTSPKAHEEVIDFTQNDSPKKKAQKAHSQTRVQFDHLESHTNDSNVINSAGNKTYSPQSNVTPNKIEDQEFVDQEVVILD